MYYNEKHKENRAKYTVIKHNTLKYISRVYGFYRSKPVKYTLAYYTLLFFIELVFPLESFAKTYLSGVLHITL